MRTSGTKHRGTRWFRFLDEAAYVLSEAGEPLPASEIYARVCRRGVCNQRFMPRAARTAAQILRFDDFRRFSKQGLDSRKKTTLYGLKSWEVR